MPGNIRTPRQGHCAANHRMPAAYTTTSQGAILGSYPNKSGCHFPVLATNASHGFITGKIKGEETTQAFGKHAKSWSGLAKLSVRGH
jgi:hypothetical protein